MKRANVILEYSVLLFAVVGFLVAINSHLRRSVQGRVKAEADKHMHYGKGFLWQGSSTSSSQSAVHDRYEFDGGEVSVKAKNSSDFDTVNYPTPPGAPASGLHAQDAAQPAPKQKNAKHRQTKYRRKIRLRR